MLAISYVDCFFFAFYFVIPLITFFFNLQKMLGLDQPSFFSQPLPPESSVSLINNSKCWAFAHNLHDRFSFGWHTHTHTHTHTMRVCKLWLEHKRRCKRLKSLLLKKQRQVVSALLCYKSFWWRNNRRCSLFKARNAEGNNLTGTVVAKERGR